jgi:hypothetical protein
MKAIVPDSTGESREAVSPALLDRFLYARDGPGGTQREGQLLGVVNFSIIKERT